MFLFSPLVFDNLQIVTAFCIDKNGTLIICKNISANQINTGFHLDRKELPTCPQAGKGASY